MATSDRTPLYPVRPAARRLGLASLWFGRPLNVNHSWRAPVAGSVAVMVIDGGGATANTTVPLAELESQLDGGLSGTLIWFTVKKGEVTRLEEQFLP